MLIRPAIKMADATLHLAYIEGRLGLDAAAVDDVVELGELRVVLGRHGGVRTL